MNRSYVKCYPKSFLSLQRKKPERLAELLVTIINETILFTAAETNYFARMFGTNFATLPIIIHE